MNLTITLTLKGREPFTYRWMQYMNEMHCPYKILIADGGDDSSLEEHLLKTGNYPNLDYEYIRYPYDISLDVFYRKLENVISRVQTDYILQADNDDFYLLARIPQLIAFLNDNQDYVAARGQLVNFELFNSLGSSKGQVSGKYYKAICNDALSLDDDCALQRVESLCLNMSKYDYYSNWYSIFRTDVLQSIWRDLIILPNKEVIVNEILIHVCMVKRGKIKIFPLPFYLRQNNTSESAIILHVGNEFLERCLINNSLQEFVVAVEKYISKDRNERDRILKSIASWFEVFVANIYLERVRNNSGLRYHLNRMIKRIPVFGSLVEDAYINLVHHVFPIRKRKRLRIKEIEPFVIKSNEIKELKTKL